GSIYFAPITFSPIVLAYNRDMFEAANLPSPDISWTREQFLDAAMRLTTGDEHMALQYGFGFSASINRWPFFLLQQGGRCAMPGELFPMEASAIKALTFVFDLFFKYKVSPTAAIGRDYVIEELFREGKLGMILTSYY